MSSRRPSARATGRRLAAPLGALICVAAGLGGCGPSGNSGSAPVVGLRGQAPAAAQKLGFPTFATKNTTRVGGADPIADAAAVARAVYPATAAASRPPAVALVSADDWGAALAATSLMAAPLRAPVLFSHGADLPAASADALSVLAPTGAPAAGGAQVIRVGTTAGPSNLRAASVQGPNPFALAAGVDQLNTRVRGRASQNVLAVNPAEAQYAMPAAAWAAKSGDPILFLQRDRVPPETRTALAARQSPHIYVLGPPGVVDDAVLAQLRTLGDVKRIRGPDPVANSVAFARFNDGIFGWGATDPGHGLLFVNEARPLDAVAAAPLASSGSYGPLLVLDRPEPLPPALNAYLLDVQPGYTRDPVRGVYNHGWIIGDQNAVSLATQAAIDSDLEIVPVNTKAKPSPSAAGQTP